MKVKNKIKEELKKIFTENPKISGISFTPKNQSRHLEVNAFTLKGKKLEYINNDIGTMYHIVLYNQNKYGEISNVDSFEAILSGPEVYINNMISLGFYGFIVKKTKKLQSKKFVNSILRHIYE